MKTIKQIKERLLSDAKEGHIRPNDCVGAALLELLMLLDRPEPGVRGKDAPPPERLTRAKIREVFAEWWSGYHLDPNYGYSPEEKEDHMAEAFIGGAEWAAEEACRWRPIEEAPKDGTRILGFGIGTDKGSWPCEKPMPAMQCVIYWTYHDVEDFEETESCLFKKVTKRVLEMWQPIGPHFFKPTHWMPLPPPPSP